MKPKPAFGAAVIALAPFLSLLVVSSTTVASVGESEENVHLVPATEPPGAWTLQWTGRTGRTYFVQHSHDLQSWTYLNTIKHGEGAKMLGTSSTGSKYFLRLRHTDIPCVDPATADFDGDGLNNADELFWGTDPFIADGDSDGFSDGWEVMVGWDPKQNNANQAHLDPDGDGWDNATEHLYGTNPNLADSDEDGLDDPDDADPNDSTIDWPRAPEATRIWIPLTGYDPSTHGAPVALSNTGIALFEKAIWKAGAWKTLEAQKPGPSLDFMEPAEAKPSILTAAGSIDIADDGRVIGWGNLSLANPEAGDLSITALHEVAVQWTEQDGTMVMEMTGGNASGGLDLETYFYWPRPEGVSPDGVLFTAKESSTLSPLLEWGRHASAGWKNDPGNVITGWRREFALNMRIGGVSTLARNTVKGGKMCLWDPSSRTNRMLSANGETPLPGVHGGYLCGSLADNRVAFVSISESGQSLLMRPAGNEGDWRPVPKLSGTAAFNARGETISRDGRFWQNGKWFSPVSEENTPPPGTMHLHDLNDHGVMLASAGEQPIGAPATAKQGDAAGLILPVELLTDIDNNGEIGRADSELAQKAFECEATEEGKIDRGTEFLFANDQRSNGLWDGEDSDQDKPADVKDDDDAQQIKIKPGITEGEVWLEHPAIAALSFYKTRECKPGDKINLSPGSKFTVSKQNPFPEMIFIRAENVSFPDITNPQIEGNLVLKIKLAQQEIEAAKLRLAVVKEFGAKKFFHAAQDYILENNTPLFLHSKSYNDDRRVLITVMRERATIMRALDSYHHGPTKLHGIDAVNNQYPNATVIINGNMTFDRQNYFEELEMTRRCHGRLVSGSALNTLTSSDNDDENVPPPNLFGVPHPLRGSELAGENGKYIAMVADGNFTFAKGRVPLSPMPKEALGGLSTNYSIQNSDQLAGVARLNETERMLFTITCELTTSGVNLQIAADARRSGVEALPGGDPHELQMFRFDGGTSLALSHKKPNGATTTPIKGSKHTGRILNDYCIHTYLMFKSERPR